MRNLVIFGDTQFAERLSKYIILEGMDRVCAFTQEARFMTRTEINGIPVIPFERLGDTLKEDFSVILGIGYKKMNTLKSQLYKLCVIAGYKVSTYISTRAIVYTEDIDEGSFICPGAIIGPDCKIGVGNYIGSSVTLAHDNKVGNFNHLAPSASFGGSSVVGNNCFFGLNSTIKDGITIADDTLIGASANVLKSISCGGGYL